MDLPATQAMGEDELPATQQFAINEDNEKTLVGTLLINNRTYSIFSGVTKIGRNPECQIVLNNETVSKIHAEIEAESPNKTVFIRDLNSSNRTRINKSKLRANSSYQIRGGDELMFGNVIAIFKVYQPINDSLVSCTPQVNRKLNAIIPSTPDSSMNTSSASESDVSVIPGTQTDKTDSNFRHPEIPVRSSKSNEHSSPRVPAFTLDDLPSPLPKEKSRQDDICEAETQRFSTNDTKEDRNNDENIYNAATQKPSTVTKIVDPDDNIYEMATQRPTDFNEETDELENVTTQRPDHKYPESSKVTNNQSISDLETQPFNTETSNSDKRKSLEISTHSAATQKNISNTSGTKFIEDLETQQFNLVKTDIDNRKSNDLSIYSAATQKNECNKSNSKSIEDLETQAFDIGKLNISNRKSNDLSIYGAPTQKNIYDVPIESIENLETQQFEKEKSNTTNNGFHDTSIHSAATQKNVSEDTNKSIENSETQPFDVQKTMSNRQSLDVSIYSAATQKVNYNALQESIENIETQPFNINQSDKFLAPSPLQRKYNKSLHDAETQRCTLEKSAVKSIEDMETQQFTTDITINKFKTSTSKDEVSNKFISEVETQKFTSAEPTNESIDDVETEQFVDKTLNQVVDESTESMHLVDESEKLTSSLSFTNLNMKTLSCTELKYGLDRNVSRTDIKDSKELSFDSDIQKTEQENNQNNTSENQNNSNLQCSKPQQFPFIEDNNKSNTEKDSEDNVPQTVKSIEEGKSILEGEDEDEMFSQNLIEDCPFAFLPEESTTNENESSETSKTEERTEIKKNEITSTNAKNNDSETTDNKNHNIINESDSETDEEGIFTNHSSNEEKNNQSNFKGNSVIKKGAVHKETDSETDEEGEFSNNLSNQSESDIKNNKEDGNKNSNHDSETDEEGVFSDRIVKDKNKSSSNKDNNDDSDEDIFGNIPEVKEKTNLNVSNISISKKGCLIRQRSPTPDSQDLIFDDNCEVKRNNIQEPQTVNDTYSSEKTKINNIEVDDLAPTQVINTGISNTDNFAASTQVIVNEKASMQKIDENLDHFDLAPTQKIVDTQPCSESQFPTQIGSRQSNDHWNTKNNIDLAPTQKIEDTQLCTESQFVAPIDKQLNDYKTVREKFELAPTQIIEDTQPCTESQFATPSDNQLKHQSNAEKRLDLEPTQIISETEPCTESQLITKIIVEKSNDQNSPINSNVSIEDSKSKSAQTHVISDSESKMSLNQSKRQLEELEITCNKKLKITDNAQNIKLDLYNNVEENLDEMFEGPENEHAVVDQSALLTQQLANILESSQNDDSLVTDLNESKPSPTLSSGRISKTKNRRRAMLLTKPDSFSPLVKPVINLNDTIEKNLNEMFDDSINNMETYEPEEMLTQQLKNVLQSQDDHHTANVGAMTITKSPILCKTYEKKRHPLSLSVNLNSSMASKKQEEQQKTKSSCVQSSSKNNIADLQETDEYFANLKSIKKCNVIDSQSDEEPMNTQSSTDDDKEIVYKRGMVGFSAKMKPVSTKEPVALLEPKSKSFTSDSQSDGDESFSILSHKKRFSLSLSKHVDLNSSLSSLIDQEVGKKLSTKSSTPSLKKTGNKHPSSTSHHAKRVFARGIRGFTSELKPVESEELVSAASTESDEELRSLATTSKKVCTSKLYRKVTVNLTKLSPLTIAMRTSKLPTSEIVSDSDSDDSEFLKSMPPIKVAGTADCPPMNSQLAATSDSEDDNDNSLKIPSPVDIVIPPKWNWYSQKRYDLIYKKDAPKSPKTMLKIVEDENRGRSPSLEKADAKVLSVDDVLAEIDANQPIGKKRIMATPKQHTTRRRSANDSDENVDEKIVKTRSTRLSNKNEKKAKSTPTSSPQLDIKFVTENKNGSFSKAQATDLGDSDSELNIIPKFTPLPRFKLNMNYKDDSDSDPEFEQLRLQCERLLSRPSSYAPHLRHLRGGPTPTANRTREKASPVITRRRRLSALSNYDSLNVTHAGSNRKAETSSKAGTVDQSAFLFQEADDSSKVAGETKTIQSRMPSLTIIRTKRSVASDVEDVQNRPPKRSKSTAVDEERPKLQQLSPAPVTAANLDKKGINKVPKTLDSFVVRHSSRKKMDSSDTSVIDNSVVKESQNEKSNGSQTRGRATAMSRKKTNPEAPTLHSNYSSKENLVVENSDVENVPNTSTFRNTRLRRNQHITDSSVIKNSSKDKISISSVENYDNTKTRGRATRQKKDLPVKRPVATVIQDSDPEESDESEFVKMESKNRLVKVVQLSDSEKSNNSKVVDAESQNENEKTVEKAISGKSNKLDVNVITRDTRNKRTQRVKESDSEKMDSSVNVIGKRINTRTRRGMKVEDSSFENSNSSDNAATKANTSDQNKNAKESDSGKSEVGGSKTSRSKRIKQSDTIKVESKIEKSHESKFILDSDSEKPEAVVKLSRSRRVKDAQTKKTNVTINKETTSRRANTRSQSSDSVFSESDTEKNKNLLFAIKSNSFRSVRQTRKRKATTNVSTVDASSSEESQEIAEIMKNSSEEDANRSQKRKTRRAKDTLNSSEDTQDSESNNTHIDKVFEKPVNRPKRARLVKSTKNKSSTQDNLLGDEEIRICSLQQSSTSQRRTPSPELPCTPSRSTPSRNRRTMSMSPMKGASYKVLFTGERTEVHRKIVAKLGGSEMEDPQKCSILVTDKVRRTYKFLCCLAQGIPIVSVDWLNDSGKARRFLNWENYVLQDPTAEAKFNFNLKESLEKAVNHSLLKGYTVLITPRITQPPVTELKGMVISSGGKPLIKPPIKWPENTIIITKEEDFQNAKKFITKAPKSVTVHSTEFILTGILRQELSLEEFKLTV